MKERFLILLWIPVVYFIYTIGMLYGLLFIVVNLGVYEICKRDGDVLLKCAAILHMFGVVFLGILPIKELCLVVLVVVANDTFAYFGGKYFNFSKFMKKKIFPRVSPKKTVGGFIYGIIFGSLIGCLFIFLSDSLRDYCFFTIPICLLAVAGDFLESKFKRICGIKDSGEGLFTERLLRGHGGIYDRFDAIALAGPGMFVLTKLFL